MGRSQFDELYNRVLKTNHKSALQQWWKVLTLGFLGGFFIGLGAIIANYIISSQEANLTDGVVQFIAGLIFSIGFIFNFFLGGSIIIDKLLMSMAVYKKKISIQSMIRDVSLVFIGNIFGALFIAFVATQANVFSDHNLVLEQKAVKIMEHLWYENFFSATIGGLIAVVILITTYEVKHKTSPSLLLILLISSALYLSGFYMINIELVDTFIFLMADVITFGDFGKMIYTFLIPVLFGNILSAGILIPASFLVLIKKVKNSELH